MCTHASALQWKSSTSKNRHDPFACVYILISDKTLDTLALLEICRRILSVTATFIKACALQYTHANTHTALYIIGPVTGNHSGQQQHQGWQSRLQTRLSLALQLTAEPLRWNSITTASPAAIHQRRHNTLCVCTIHVCTHKFLCL